jgi:hypothetical protein
MIQEARKNGNRRRGQMTREITYQKVLLAVYVLSDEEGLDCHASDRALAEASGRSVSSVRWALAEMERRDVIWIFGPKIGLKRRSFSLTDHPKNQRQFDDPVPRPWPEIVGSGS